MNEQNSAVMENPVVSAGVADLIGQEAAAPQPGNVVDLNTAQLPGITPPTDAEKAALVAKLAAEHKAKEETALARFDVNTGFKLTGEVIGHSTKRTVSKSGAVTVGIKTKKDLAVVSGLKGSELDAFVRMRRDEVKNETCLYATRLAGDNNWTGQGVTMSGKGNKVTLTFVKAEPVKVSLAAEPSDEAIAKAMGWTVEQVKLMKEVNKAAAAKAAQELADKAAKAIADEAAAKELADEEAKRVADEAAKNGQVHAPEAE